MTNKITEAAKAAGGTIYTNRHYPGETACAFGPEALARFYAIAYRAGLEDAAKLLETKKEWRGGKWVSTLSPETASAIAAAIRALMKETP